MKLGLCWLSVLRLSDHFLKVGWVRLNLHRRRRVFCLGRLDGPCIRCLSGKRPLDSPDTHPVVPPKLQSAERRVNRMTHGSLTGHRRTWGGGDENTFLPGWMSGHYWISSEMGALAYNFASRLHFWIRAFNFAKALIIKFSSKLFPPSSSGCQIDRNI